MCSTSASSSQGPPSEAFANPTPRSTRDPGDRRAEPVRLLGHQHRRPSPPVL
nr:MAG TPA: hypothetical protein [Caudoviricetes sp.]